MSVSAQIRRSELPWVAGTLAVLAAITALDGREVSAALPWNQAVSTALTVAWWWLLFRHAGLRLRRTMVFGVALATVGELLFCKALGLYEYRLGNIPAYVPPGHTILYATVHLFIRDGWVRRARWLWAVLAAVGAAYSLTWLALRGDQFGFACFALFAALVIAVPRSRLFFGAMYLLVSALELSGTHWGCWRWQPAIGPWPSLASAHLSSGAPGLLTWARIPSANPPSGVALFYVLYDLACLAVYFFWRWTAFERWVALSWSAKAQSGSPL